MQTERFSQAAPPAAALLSVEDVCIEFNSRNQPALVLNGVSFELHSGETVCIVGESGCGKSMTALAILGLVPTPPGKVTRGAMRYREEDLFQADETRLRQIRGNRISMIFQEPMTSLNPVFSVGDQIGETLRLHAGLSRSAARQRTIDMLRQVGIPAPERRIDEYPHQLSGGMRQRVMIAMALACEPDILIADEPTTALDVTVQAQIFDLLRDIQSTRGTAILLITHDIGAVAEMADRVIVMYAGRVVEQGGVDEVLGAPLHPYTQGLIACLPELGTDVDAPRAVLREIEGVVPSLWQLPPGCAFQERCPHRHAHCSQEPPMMGSSGASSTHRAACWLIEQLP